MYKNTAGQKWVVFAFDRTDNTAKTGDAANITANLRIDGAAANAVDDTNPTELEDGYYAFDISQAESNGDNIVICPASTTADIQVIGVPGAVWTRQVTVAQTGDAYAIVNHASYGNALLARTADISTDSEIAVAARTEIDLNSTQLAAIKIKTDYLPSAAAGAAGGVFIAGINAATSVTTALTANVTGNLSGSVGSVTGAVGSVTADVGITQTGADKVWGSATRTLTSLGTLIADIWAYATRVLTAATNLSIPSAADNADAVWDEAISGHAGAGSTGATLAAASAPSAAAVADAVWDETLASHLTAGSTGAGLNAAGSAGDPWATALPGAYGAGSAGKIIGDNVNATISSRSTLTAQQVWEYATRTVSSFGTLVADVATAVWGAVARTITGGVLDAAYDAAKTAAPASTALSTAVWTNTKAGYLDEAISAAKALTAAYDAAKTAAQASTALSNVTWTDARAAFLDQAISAAKTLTAAYDAAKTAAPAATALTNATWTDAKAAYLDQAISAAKTLTAAYDAAKTAAPASTALNNTVWTDARAAYLDQAVSAAKTLTAAYDAAKAAASQTSVDALPTATEILSQALAAESYAADGATPNLSQVLWMIWAAVSDYGVSGTTITVRNQAGTAAMTFTIDDGTNPTSRTRAT